MSRSILNKIFITSALMLTTVNIKAQQNSQPTAAQQIAVKAADDVVESDDPLFQGVTFSFDLVGVATKIAGDYGCYEGAFRVNLKNKYFPVFEYGLGFADKTDETTNIHYKTSAPYFRAGIDFNMLKNKHQSNRLYVGLRGAYTTYEYDNEAPVQVDPVWLTQADNSIKGVSSNMLWMEIVCGVEAEVLKNLHMGWSLRYKSRLSQKDTKYGDPWYVPGYGINGTSRFGATYNLIFDLPFWKPKKVSTESNKK